MCSPHFITFQLFHTCILKCRFSRHGLCKLIIPNGCSRCAQFLYITFVPIIPLTIASKCYAKPCCCHSQGCHLTLLWALYLHYKQSCLAFLSYRFMWSCKTHRVSPVIIVTLPVVRTFLSTTSIAGIGHLYLAEAHQINWLLDHLTTLTDIDSFFPTNTVVFSTYTFWCSHKSNSWLWIRNILQESYSIPWDPFLPYKKMWINGIILHKSIISKPHQRSKLQLPNTKYYCISEVCKLQVFSAMMKASLEFGSLNI